MHGCRTKARLGRQDAHPGHHQFVDRRLVLEGAMLAIGSFFRFLNLPLHEYQLMLLVSEAVLFILGLGYQVHLTRKKS